MAVTPTPEENGRRILDIYKQFHSEAGHVLRATNFIAVAARRNWSTRHLSEGLEYARKHGWVEELSSGGIALTPTGYKSM